MVQAKIKYLDIVWYHRWFALTLFAIVLIVVTVVTVSLPKVYKIDSEIYIAPKPNMVTGDAVSFTDYDYRMLNNQIEILGSDTVARKAVEIARKRLGKDYPVSKSALQSSLGITKKDYTSVIALSFTSAGKPADLKVMMDAYLEAYISTLRDINSDKAREEARFLKEQLKVASEEFAQAGRALKDFQTENHTYAPDTQLGQLLSLHNRLEEQMTSSSADLAGFQKQAAVAKKHLPTSPEYINLMSRVERDPEVSSLRKQIVDLESTKAEWSAKVTDAHPKMIAYNQELARLKELLRKRLETFSRTFKQHLPANADDLTTGSNLDFSLASDVITNQIKLEAIQARYGSMRAARSELQEMLKGVPQQQLSYMQLKNDVDAAQEKMRVLRKRLDEATLMEAVSSNFTKVEVLKEPQVPVNPLRPNLGKNLMAAVLLGVCFSLFAVFIRATLDKTLHWPFQLKGILEDGKQAIFTMPAIPGRQTFRMMLERTNFTVPEPYKRLVIHLENLSKQEQVRRIGVIPVSPFPDCNMTTVALSLYLTELSNKMVLIDTDFSPNAVSQLIGSLRLPISLAVEEGPGLTDYLNGASEDFVDIIYPLGKTVYGSFIPTGSSANDTGFQFSHRNLGQLEAQLSPNYNFVLYALPPVDQSYDSIAVGRTLDGVMLLVQPGITTIDQMQNTIRELETVNIRVLGILVQPLK